MGKKQILRFLLTGESVQPEKQGGGSRGGQRWR